MIADGDFSLTAGTRLGPYEVVSFIAAGGMGEVYAARDTRLNRIVAVKVLRPQYGTDRERLTRFEKEARSAGQLAHPNILSVYDVGEQSGLPYIVTELLEGRTLAALLHERRLALDEVVNLSLQITRGLAAAHEKRIVHRDLKPANIFITAAGHVKILDFGLAKLTQDEWRTATDDETQSLTSRPGVVVGSTGYMSPEQVQGASVDLRSDVFSFGSIIYEMLTGRRAFKGDSPVETMSAILRDDPPALDAATYGAQLVAIVNRCLTKRADGRFPSAQELLFALQQVATNAPTRLFRPHKLRRWAVNNRRSLRFAAALATVTVVSLFIGGLSQSRQTHQPIEDPLLRVTSVERATSDGRVRDAAISPDGSFLAYATIRLKSLTLRLRHVSSGSDIDLLPPLEDRLFSTAGFSADRNFIYFREFAQRGTGHRGSPLWDPVALVRLPLLGGTPQPVLSGWFSKVRVAPNGTSVAFVRWEKDGSKSAVVVADPAFRAQRVAAELRSGAAFVGDPAWSNDSRRLLVGVAASGPEGDARPMEVDVTTGATRRLPLCDSIDRPTYVHSAMGGGWIVQNGSNNQLWHVPREGRRCRQLTDDTLRWQLADTTADGRTVLAVGTQHVQNLWSAFRREGEAPVRLTQGINTGDGSGGVAILADRTVVFTRNESGKIRGKPHLWILDGGGNIRQLTTGDAAEADPAASPDGRSIVYAVTRVDTAKRSHTSLQLMDVRTGESRTLTDASPMNASFSPDGSWIYYADYPGGSYPARLKKIAAAGGSPQDVTVRTNCDFIRVSPDARWISCFDKNVLMIMSMADGDVLRTLKMPPKSGKMRWLPDSTAVTYVQNDAVGSTVWAVPLRGQPSVIVRVPGDEISGPYAWLPDGQSLVCTRASDVSDAFLLRLGR